MKNILITGSNGYIARNIASKLKNYDLTLVNKNQLDLTDSHNVNAFFKDKYFDVVIQTAVKGGTRLVQDTENDVYHNCLIHLNLLRNQKNFGKYISFGSGAELNRNSNIGINSNMNESFPTDPYGMSKWLIAKTGESYDKFYNIRIFNIFNEDELTTRMIKNNIFRYIDKKNIIIHQDKYMDFMYFDDFIKIIEFFINNDDCPKSINCCYEQKYLLTDIAKIINNLNKYHVDIEIENEGLGNSYIGQYELDKYNIVVSSLELGIKKCYQKFLG